MFYLFGWGQTTNRDIDSVRLKCRRCGHLASFNLRLARSWLSFFFIPVIPYSRQYWFVCSNCDSGYKFDDRQDFERFHKKLIAFKKKKLKKLILKI